MRIRPFLLFPILLSACGGEVSDKPILVSSIYPIQYLLQRIGGTDFSVINLTPAGTEPHDFELTIGAAKALSDSQAVFLNGLHMEPYQDSLRPTVKTKTHVLSDGIATRMVDGQADPHIWLNTLNYKKMGQKVCDVLCSLVPERASHYQANFASFSNDIDTLTAACMEIASSFVDKAIAVSHEAYGYMCDQFGITQFAINGLSPNQEPSQKAIEALLDVMKQRGIDTVFFEELASPLIAESIAKRAGAKVEELNPIEGLTPEEIEDGETYFTIYLENMNKIAEAKP